MDIDNITEDELIIDDFSIISNNIVKK